MSRRLQFIAVPVLAGVALSGCSSYDQATQAASVSGDVPVATTASAIATTRSGAAAGTATNVEGGAFCKIPYQKGATAQGRTLTCKKTKDGKWRWL
ncbi:MAG: hypothetical protein JWN00_457 [Actinomycetia bacterium]|nr:hypothetical protein [Actinomycetes bacterium]